LPDNAAREIREVVEAFDAKERMDKNDDVDESKRKIEQF